MSNDDAIVSCVTLTGWEYVPMLAQAAELAKEITSLLNRLVDERTENMRLRAALRPFAEAADGFDATRIKNPEEWFAYGGIVSATETKGAITVGDLRRARAALDGQPAPSGWRPIETAPKDGTEVLMVFVFEDGETLHRVVRWDASEMWPWRDEYTGYREREAKGWLPLPPAPGKEE